MKIFYTFAVAYAVCLLAVEISGEQNTKTKRGKKTNLRPSRQLNNNNADQMVQNILKWLQDVYGQQSRSIRQDALREYLPPTMSQKPRPFEPRPVDNGGGVDNNGNFVDSGYPPAGSVTPQPPFTIYTNPATGGITGIGSPGIPDEYSTGSTETISSATTNFPLKTDVTEVSSVSTKLSDVTENNQDSEPSLEIDITSGTTYLPPVSESIPTKLPDVTGSDTGTTPGPESPTQGPQVTEQVTGYPTRPPYQPGISTQPPELIVPGGGDQTSGTSEQTPGTSEQGIPEVTPGYTTGIPVQETQGYPSGKPQSEPTGYPSIGTSAPSGFTASTEIPSFPTIKPTTGEPAETESPSKPIEETEGPLPSSESATAQPSSAIPEVTGTVTEGITGQTEGELPGASSETPTEDNPATGEENAVKGVPDDDDSKHPPHIHALDVQCAKEMMTIDIEFNREFDGVIYSKGYYNMPECRYVNENSGQTKYTFTVNLNMCGTEFVNAFDTEGRSYLENVLVLQNEAGIQEVWDTVRSVRCLWEGSLKEQLSVTLMVGMLSQEIVTFSGDTAVAKLDVVLGRGPFGQPASGLVKIGEQMTLVVSVSGDPGFDVQVKDCRAADSSGSNIVPLTDDNGCILKPKLFGSFQKTRNTGETGASIIAYAYFNAFKFPDVMDIMIECNIELCKTDCEMCPEPNQQIEPAKRRKRDISNETLHDSILMAKHLRVVLPEDLTSAVDLVQRDGVCVSTQSFVYSTSILISLLTASCLLSAYLWFTKQKQKSVQF
ncbi:uncharacterized protein LOC130446607 [Diorhabda sublineata]|uniref:uncharacterized protein LOC130446607 n=1 Tax=Diorhabda sublineata TaxID=1163346 RepID=UPI0024E041D6|nr:uncharacterized protein LOC130446607 [Diorhabda sublineata]